MYAQELSRPKPKTSRGQSHNEVELKPLIEPSYLPGVSNTQGLSGQALHFAFGPPSQPSIPTHLQNPFPKPLAPQQVYSQLPQQHQPPQQFYPQPLLQQQQQQQTQQQQQQQQQTQLLLQQQPPPPYGIYPSTSSLYPKPFSPITTSSVSVTSELPHSSSFAPTWPLPLGVTPLQEGLTQASPPRLYPTLEPKFIPNDEKKETKNTSHKKNITENQKGKKNGKQRQEIGNQEEMKELKLTKTNEKGKKAQTKEHNFTKRCIKCQQYYVSGKEESENPCRYHPGSYRRAYSSALLAGASIQYWSCCRASAKDQPGCVTDQHKEDPKVTQIQLRIQQAMDQIPTKEESPKVEPEQPKEPQVGVLIDASFTTATEKEEKETKKENNVIRHYVTEVDTLIGLSLRYRVPAKMIRQLNRMPSDDVQAFSRLYIPKPGYDLSVIKIDDEDDTVAPPKDLTDTEKVLFEKRMTARMRSTTGVSHEEALYYLSLHGFSYAQAMAEYNGDIEFEKTTPFRPAKKCK